MRPRLLVALAILALAAFAIWASVGSEETSAQTNQPVQSTPPVQQVQEGRRVPRIRRAVRQVEPPAGYSWQSSVESSFIGLRQPSADEIAITTEYFRLAIQHVGGAPTEPFDAEDAQAINVTFEGQDVDAATLAASIPRFPSPPPLGAQIEAALQRGIATCDKPSLIFRDMRNVGCIPGSRIQRISVGDVDWVMVFRKNNDFFADPNLFNEIGLIASNRENGRTAFFPGQGTVSFRLSSAEWPEVAGVQTDSVEVSMLTGKEIPPPNADNPASVKHWSIPMGGSRGGSCIECHSNGPFLSFPFTDFASYDKDGKPTYYVESAKRGGGRVVPARSPGQLYEPFNYLHSVEFGQFMAAYQPQDTEDAFYKNVMRELGRPDRFEARRLVAAAAPQAKACTACHHIGNGSYIQRFPDAAFYLYALGSGHDLETEKAVRFDRSFMLLKNTTPSFLTTPNTAESFMHTNIGADGQPILFPRIGFHNRKVTIKDELHDFRPEPVQVYRDALEELRRLAADSRPEQWQPHWTVDRVAANPLEYLRSVCTSCHDGEPDLFTDGTANRRLFDKQDFMQNAAALLRINDASHPMPSSGQLQPAVREILSNYLEPK